MVTNTNDSGAGSLRATLALAGDGETIDARFISGTIALTSGALLVLNESAIITGPGPGLLRVDGNHNRVFKIGVSPLNSSKTVTIAGLAIYNGSASGDFPENAGGGIYNENTTLIVVNCYLLLNSADLAAASTTIVPSASATATARR